MSKENSHASYWNNRKMADGKTLPHKTINLLKQKFIWKYRARIENAMERVSSMITITKDVYFTFGYQGTLKSPKFCHIKLAAELGRIVYVVLYVHKVTVTESCVKSTIHGRWDSLQLGPERPLCDAVMVKSELQCRTHDAKFQEQWKRAEESYRHQEESGKRDIIGAVGSRIERAWLPKIFEPQVMPPWTVCVFLERKSRSWCFFSWALFLFLYTLSLKSPSLALEVAMFILYWKCSTSLWYSRGWTFKNFLES